MNEMNDKATTNEAAAAKTAAAVAKLNALINECKNATPTGGGESKAAKRRAKQAAFNLHRREIGACIAKLQINSASLKTGTRGSFGAVHFTDYVRK
jgi:hypothetical protein